MIRKNPFKFFLLTLVLIALDQGVKLAVHHYMAPGFAGQIKVVGDWLKLHYVLNPGMAFGMQLGYEYGKLLLSVFRLFAMVGIGYYLVHLAHRGAPNGLLWAMSMILAGAVGNVIDSTFYGVFLNNAPYGSPTPWFHGQVIDMIFVDVWEGFIPEWVPIWGGQYYSTPIFNIADSCIFIGVCLILFFQRRFFGEPPLEDNLLPTSGPDATEAAVLPMAEVQDEADQPTRPVASDVTDQPASTDPLPDEADRPHPKPASVTQDEPKPTD
ncbi:MULTISPECIES: lipoprotein signal peptidase [Spirosoma]|uniref:Lipoprotein signal peptidase n=1 Tax=Spirosoma sordidisoli TaxID=2502893 RepID=A0A4V1RVN1_9BACT|nr:MULTISPECIES: lipoprotein signal peptidase [Spirosoma]RYC67348.1 lipoprotein signal peptidase [Spirosoma sordidisoli]